MYGPIIPKGNVFCVHNKQLIRMETLLALLFVHGKAAILGAVSLHCVVFGHG